MSKNIKKHILLALFLELIIITPVYSQGQTTIVPPNTFYYNQHYTVKVGDEVTYKYQTLYSKDGYFQDSIELENLSYIDFNLTQGMEFKILIYSINIDSVYAQSIYNIPNLGKIISRPSPLRQPYLSRAFDNYSIATQYVNDQSAYNPRFNYSINGDQITVLSSSTQNQKITITNWKTGWLESENSIFSSPNGTILQQVEIIRATNIFGIDANTILTLATYSTIPIFFAIGAFLAIKFKRDPKK